LITIPLVTERDATIRPVVGQISEAEGERALKVWVLPVTSERASYIPDEVARQLALMPDEVVELPDGRRIPCYTVDVTLTLPDGSEVQVERLRVYRDLISEAEYVTLGARACSVLAVIPPSSLVA